MSMDWPAALAAIVNSTRELPLSTVLVAALATGSERQRVAAAGRQPDGERDDLQSNEDASHLQSIKANPGPAAA